MGYLRLTTGVLLCHFFGGKSAWKGLAGGFVASGFDLDFTLASFCLQGGHGDQTGGFSGGLSGCMVGTVSKNIKNDICFFFFEGLGVGMGFWLGWRFMAVLMTMLFLRRFILLNLLIKPSNLNNGTPQTSKFV